MADFKLYTLDNKFIDEMYVIPDMFTGIIKINNETIQWRMNGKIHREDGPAWEYADGEKRWYVDGFLHRIDGPAVEYANGTKTWYINGKLHRVGGPAIEYSDGSKDWYLDGQCHRLDGPAVERLNGPCCWYINNKQVTEEQCKLLYDIMKLKGLLDV